MKRCPWVPSDNAWYQQYHDAEWGVPTHEDKRHFEFLILEGAQAGLSWATILKRREGYRTAFVDFEVKRVADFDESDIHRLMNDAGIIRNRAKITSAITNAQRFLLIQQEFGSFDKYVWSFVNDTPIIHQLELLTDYPTTIPEAEKLSCDLKQRGFSFVGPTIMYAHMQACGLVNDHTLDCFRRKELLDD